MMGVGNKQYGLRPGLTDRDRCGADGCAALSGGVWPSPLDLTHSLAGEEVKLWLDLLRSHFLTSYAEKHTDDLAVALGELMKRAVNLLR